MSKHAETGPPQAPASRQEEGRSFAFLTIVMAPLLSGLLIAGYGFLVWAYQMFAGPPGS